ncbi:GntR family transcriptional regulator [Desulfomarina sp.]
MPIPGKTKPLSRSIMREEVYNTLLKWIMEGELRPGEKLLDKELAEHMGVSRTPVREALRRLEDKELVESSANRWTRVSEVSIKEPERIYPIIWTLEELAVSLAVLHLTQEDFEKMEVANTALGIALDTEDPVKASLADIQFHDVFIERSGNHHLVTILRDLKIKYRRVEVTYFEGYASAKYSLEEHYDILDALRSGDVEGAQAKIRSNWQNSLRRLKDIESRTMLSSSGAEGTEQE